MYSFLCGLGHGMGVQRVFKGEIFGFLAFMGIFPGAIFVFRIFGVRGGMFCGCRTYDYVWDMGIWGPSVCFVWGWTVLFGTQWSLLGCLWVWFFGFLRGFLVVFCLFSFKGVWAYVLGCMCLR